MAEHLKLESPHLARTSGSYGGGSHLALCVDCCERVTAVTVTVSGLTGCFSTWNGSYVLGAAGCVWSYLYDYPLPGDPCGTDALCSYEGSADPSFPRTHYLVRSRVHVSLTARSGTGSPSLYLGTLLMRTEVYYNPAYAPGCYRWPAPFVYATQSHQFQRAQCNSGAAAVIGSSYGYPAAGYGLPPPWSPVPTISLSVAA